MVRRIALSMVVLAGLVAVLAGYAWIRHLKPVTAPVVVTFEARDGTSLVGDLYLPDGEGPFPAMTLIPGSGRSPGRDVTYVLHANAFAREGFAVFLYDKRGIDRSEGDFESATFPEFISDALSAVEMLRNRIEIDGTRMGLVGISEGAWFTPEVAVRAGDMDFVINLVMPALLWSDTVLYEWQNDLAREGLNQSAIDQVLALRLAIWDYYTAAAVSRDPLLDRRTPLEEELARVRSEGWLDNFRMGVGDYDPDIYAAWIADIYYDPAPWIVQLDAPLFAVFAEDDENTPTDRSLARLVELRTEHELDIETRVYPGRTHSMFKPQDLVSGFGYPPDYLPSTATWAAGQIE